MKESSLPAAVDQLGLVRRHQANVMSNNISDAGKNRIAEVLRHDRFIEAVKLHRELTGSDLLAAKSSVERKQAGQQTRQGVAR